MTLRVSPAEIVARSSDPLVGIHDSWSRVELGRVAEILNGFAFKSSHFNKDGVGLPLIRIRDVGKSNTETHYSGEYDSRYIVAPGSLIIGMDGDFRVSRWGGPPALLNQRVCKLTVREGCSYDERFLLHVLPGYLKAVHEATSSVTVKHLSSRTVEKFPLPLPPLSEQRRIVEAIEEQFSRLDAAEGLLGSGQNRLQALRSKVLGLAAAGRLGLAAARTDFAPDDEWIPPDWRWTTVRDLALEEHPVLTGPFGTSLSRKDFAKSGVPVLTIGCLTDGGVRLDKAEYVSQEKATELSRYRVRGGDVLFSRMATVGRAGVVTKDHDGALINYHLMRLRLDSHVILPDFFLIYVRGASRVRRYLREVGHGATRPGVNTEQLLTMPVALPPLDQQRLVVDEVDRQLSEISATSRTVSLCFERSKVLRVVVFREAFAGRLVPQDFSNEPTSDFLEKVRL